jgi:hypothetical protein
MRLLRAIIGRIDTNHMSISRQFPATGERSRVRSIRGLANERANRFRIFPHLGPFPWVSSRGGRSGIGGRGVEGSENDGARVTAELS